MSSTRHKDIVLRQWYQELWDNWNVDVADVLFSADYQLHLSGVPTALNRNEIKHVVRMFQASFPNLLHTIDEMIAEGGTVATRWTVHATHGGDFQGIARTDKPIVLSGTTVHHLAGDQITETWLTFDNLTLLQQLGAVPRAAAAV
jgi:steroid delta-isomerase-like uncharacterized protein